MPLKWLSLAVAALVLAAIFGVSLQRPIGLEVHAAPVGEPLRTPEQWIALQPGGAGVEALRAELRQRDVHVRWNGRIYWPATGEYVLRLRARGTASVVIDGVPALALDGADPSQAAIATVAQTRGAHAIAIAYEPNGGAWIRLEWNASRSNEFHAIPPESFSPFELPRGIWPWRRVATDLFAIAGGGCGLFLIVALARVLARWLPASDVTKRRDVRLVIAGAALVFATGLWWGWPGGEWAADELTPSVIFDALAQHLSHGWADKYPPVHYYLLTIAYAPLLIAQRARETLTEDVLETVLFLVGRLLTVLMAVSIVALIARLAGRVLGARYAWPAALCAAAALPFVFYAKTTNVDVPCLFWAALSFVFLAEVHLERRARDVIGFAVTAACAIGTKDPAYGLYVLPVVHLVWTLRRSREGRRLLTLGAVAGAIALVLAFNVVFDPQGFLAHVDIVRGPASVGYRMFAPDLSGQWQLAATTTKLFAWTLGIPGVVLLAAGALALWRRDSEVRVPIWVWLFAISYYVTFLAVVGYVYDRFLLPETMILALPAAAGLRWILDEAPLGRMRHAAGAVLIVWLAWRAVSVDALMLNDSRDDAEAWLRTHITLGQSVATIGESGYGARLDEFSGFEIRPAIGATLQANPDYIVLNTQYTQRFHPDSFEGAWQAWLDSGDGPYVCVYRHQTPLTGTAFMWSPRMTDRKEDAFTNLDKIGPETAIYVRKK